MRIRHGAKLLLCKTDYARSYANIIFAPLTGDVLRQKDKCIYAHSFFINMHFQQLLFHAVIVKASNGPRYVVGCI